MEFDWEFLTKQFLTTGIFTFLVQLAINFIFNKKIETYKKEINKELENYKKELSIVINRDGSIYNKRIEVIDEFYEKVIKLNYSVLSLTSPIKPIVKDFDEEEKNRIDSNWGNFNELHKFYLIKKIYFPDNICVKVNEIIKISQEVQWHYSEPLRRKNNGLEERQDSSYYKKSKEINKMITEKWKIIIEELETEFRSFFLINPKNEK